MEQIHIQINLRVKIVRIGFYELIQKKMRVFFSFFTKKRIAIEQFCFVKYILEQLSKINI